MSTGNTNGQPQSAQFDIGKTYGLTGKKYFLKVYKRLLQKLDDAFEDSKAIEFGKFNNDITKAKSLLKDYHKTISENVEKLVDDIGDALKKLNKLNQEYANSQGMIDPAYIKNRAQHLYQVYCDRLQQLAEQEIAREKLLSEKMLAVEIRIDALAENIEAAHEKYVIDLQNSRSEFRDMEEGYRHGESLRHATMDKHDDIGGLIRSLLPKNL